jgi:hypothetical protein
MLQDEIALLQKRVQRVQEQSAAAANELRYFTHK